MTIDSRHDQTASDVATKTKPRRATKKPPQKAPPPPNMTPIRSALADHQAALADVVARFEAIGGSFGRWERQDHERIVDAMTWVEDRLEDANGGRPSRVREALQAVRRRTELLVFP
jgi:hypothetical protein